MTDKSVDLEVILFFFMVACLLWLFVVVGDGGGGDGGAGDGGAGDGGVGDGGAGDGGAGDGGAP